MQLAATNYSYCARSFVVSLAIACGLTAVNGTRAADERDVSHALGAIKVKSLNEISGMAASREHPDTLWVKNDGDDRWLFAVTTSGSLVAAAGVSADVVDVEDIAIGPGPEVGLDYLYLGDIGDNDSDRREVRVVRFAEPELSGQRGQQIEVEDPEVFWLAYPDGPRDAEALFVDSQDGMLCIVSKEDNRAPLYTVPLEELREDRTARLTKAGSPEIAEVSAGAISADGRRIMLRREDQGWLWNRRDGESVADALQRKPKKVPVRGKQQGKNGEAVCVATDGLSYFTVSEGKNQAMYQFDLPAVAADDR